MQDLVTGKGIGDSESYTERNLIGGVLVALNHEVNVNG